MADVLDDIQAPAQDPVTQPPADKTKVLYDAVSKSYNLGTYDEFKQKLQDPVKRQAFYNGVGHEYDLGSYDEFNSKIGTAPAQKKNGTPVSSNGSNNPNILQTGNELLQPVIQGSQKETNTSLQNTVQQKYKNLGMKVDKNSPQFQNDVADLHQKLDNGDIHFNDAGQVERTPKWHEELAQGLMSTIMDWSQHVDQYKALKDGDYSKLADVLEQQGKDREDLRNMPVSALDLLKMAVNPTGAMSDIATKDIKNNGVPVGEASFGGKAARMIGGITPSILLSAAGGIPAVAASSQFAGTGTKMQELYDENVQKNISNGMPVDQARTQAAEKAANDAPLAAMPDAMLNTALMGDAHVAKAATGLKGAILNTLSGATKMGLKGAAAEGATQGIQALQGYDTKDAFDKILESGKSLFLLDLSIKGVSELPNLPKYLKANMKEYLTQVPPEIVDAQAEKLGVPPEQIHNELQPYQEARQQVQGLVPDEHMANYAGLTEKQNNLKSTIEELETRKETAPAGLHPVLDEQIKSATEQSKAIDKQMKEMTASGDPNAHEIDDLTGQPIISPKTNEDVKTIQTDAGQKADAEKVENKGTAEPTGEAVPSIDKPFAPKGYEDWLTPNKTEHVNEKGVTFKLGDNVEDSGKSLGKITGFYNNYAFTDEGNNSEDKRPINTDVLTKSQPKENEPTTIQQPNAPEEKASIKVNEQTEATKPDNEGTVKVKPEPGEEPPIVPPTGKETKGSLGNEEPKTTGIKKVISEGTRIDRKLPEVELPKTGTQTEMLERGKKAVDNGEINPREVVQRTLESKLPYSPEEAEAMQYYHHQLNIRERELFDGLHESSEILKKEPDNIEAINANSSLLSHLNQLDDEIDAATKADRLNSNRWHRLGEAMQIEADQTFSPARTRQLIKENYGGEIPASVKERMDNAFKERDEAISKLKKVEDILSKKEAENAMLRIAKDAERQAKATKIKQTKEELKTEEKQLLANLKRALKKDSGNLYAGIPVPKETLDAMGKLAVNYFKQGYVTLEGLVNKLHSELKDDIEGISKREIREYISKFNPLREDVREKELSKLASKEKSITNKIESGDVLPKATTPKLEFEKNTDWIRARQKVVNAEYKLKQLKREALESKKNLYQKSLMWLGRFFRISLLSGFNVLEKLASAATIGGALKRIPEQSIGKIWSTAFKGIAEKAPIEGYISAGAEAKFYKEFFSPKKFAENTWQIVKTGQSDLSKRLGKEVYDHIPILYLPTDLHQVIKDPVKRATFEASFKNGLQWAQKQGLDITDDLVRQSIENAAYKRANYEIFQEKNSLSNWISSKKSEWETQGDVGATKKFLADFLMPVSTVPTNIVRRLASTSPGGLIRGTAKVISAYRKGIENLSNDEADTIMRQLKQGSLGTALWMIGWFGASNYGGLYTRFNPDKQRRGDEMKADQMQVDGTMIDKPIQHALPFEIIQLAATARHTYDRYIRHGSGYLESIGKAGLSAIGAAAEQIPIIDEPTNLIMGTKDDYGANKIGEDLKRRVEPTILKDLGIIQKPPKKGQSGGGGATNPF